MYVVSLSYTAPLSDIDALLPTHVAWLNQAYADGLFLASGRKVPRSGGVILARGERAGLEARLADDPFAKAGVARYDITEFVPSMTAAGLEGLKEA
ncbi:YciI family protein [Chromobacterium subtsugae]|uniref:YciI family protein n=1 Tax=Chromobacterium subtsugae TaxID=251747 RepID=UPI000640EBC2|nr:YciI family protein [Chromobacterium subtsugae]